MRIQLMAATLVCIAPTVLSGQSAYSCRTADDAGSMYLQLVKDVVGGTDTIAARQRITLQLPVVDDSAVTLVSDSTVCRSAAQSLAALFPAVANSTSGWVYRIGSTRYLIIDPKAKKAERIWGAVLDPSYLVLVVDPVN